MYKTCNSDTVKAAYSECIKPATRIQTKLPILDPLKGAGQIFQNEILYFASSTMKPDFSISAKSIILFGCAKQFFSAADAYTLLYKLTHLITVNIISQHFHQHLPNGTYFSCKTSSRAMENKWAFFRCKFAKHEKNRSCL